MQASAGSSSSTGLPPLRAFFTADFFRSLGRGFLASVLGAGPQGGLRLSSYEFTKYHLQNHEVHKLNPRISKSARQLQKSQPDFKFGLSSITASAISAVVGDLASSIVKVPREVITSRLQTSSGIGPRQVIESIIRTQGPAGFFQGFWSTTARDAPFMIILFCTYESFKQYQHRFIITRFPEMDDEIPITTVRSTLFGGISGALAGFLTTPFDVIKTKVMTSGGVVDANGVRRTPSMMKVARDIVMGRKAALFGNNGASTSVAGRIAPYSVFFTGASARLLVLSGRAEMEVPFHFIYKKIIARTPALKWPATPILTTKKTRYSSDGTIPEMPSFKRTPQTILILVLGRDPIEDEIADHQTHHHQHGFISTAPRNRKRSVSPSTTGLPVTRPRRLPSPSPTADSAAALHRSKEDLSHLYSIPRALLAVDGRPGLSYLWDYVVRSGWGERTFLVTDALSFKAVERWALHQGVELEQILNVGGVVVEKDGRNLIDALDLASGLGLLTPPSPSHPTSPITIQINDDPNNGRVLIIQSDLILDAELESLLFCDADVSSSSEDLMEPEDLSWVVVGKRSLAPQGPLRVRESGGIKVLEGVEVAVGEGDVGKRYWRLRSPPVAMNLSALAVSKMVAYVESRSLTLDAKETQGCGTSAKKGSLDSVESLPPLGAAQPLTAYTSEFLALLNDLASSSKLAVKVAGRAPGSAWGWSDVVGFEESSLASSSLSAQSMGITQLVDTERPILRDYLDRWRTHKVLLPPTPPATPLGSITHSLSNLVSDPDPSPTSWPDGPEPPLTTRANARVGLMGNPSDGFFGKTLSLLISNFWAEVTLIPNPFESDQTVIITPNPLCDPFGFQSIEVASTVCARDGYYGVGRQVGLAGSSALITALLKALIRFHGHDSDPTRFPPHVRANLALSAERDELNIAAGQQDRVIQAFGGLVFMDFDRKLMEGRGYGEYTALTVDVLPEGLWMAFVAQPSDSGKIVDLFVLDIETGSAFRNHTYEREIQIVSAMSHFAQLAQDGKDALLKGDHMKFADLMDENFNTRRRIYGDLVIGESNLKLVSIARSYGHSAKFSGSGGCVVGMWRGNPDSPERVALTKKMKRELQQHALTVMADDDDERFAILKRDPRFVRPKKNSNKVVIDPRFQAIFDSKDFGTSTRDRYGRKVKASSSSDMKRYYRMEGREEKDDRFSMKAKEFADEDEEEGPTVGDEEDEDMAKSDEEVDESALKEDEEEEDEEDEMEGSRLIRGEVLVESSDEDEEDMDLADDPDDDAEEEEEEQVERGPPAKRFAAVNLDWDNLKASDLWKAFESFKPKNGQIRSIAIIPSDFGKGRLEKEEREGPPTDIFKADDDINKPIFYDQDQTDFDERRLRKYQLERLRYYYAVIECDSVGTASAIVEGCDGAEFEKSANYFDLRYIPDDVEFENEPREKITQPPSSYIPADFTTNALQHSRVKLTWDEDDPERVRVTRRKFTKEDLKDMDFKSYLASSSDESDEEDEERVQQYKNLLLNGGEDEGYERPKKKKKDRDDDVDMEITFTPGLSEAVADTVATKKREKTETVFEAQMRMRREKRKEKAAERKRQKLEESGEVPEDDFFETGTTKVFDAETKKKSKATAAAEQAKAKAKLELIMMDENNTQSRHFDMKQILKQEKQNSKKKRKHAEVLESTQDDFSINTKDPRFAQALTSHQYAIDPTNPKQVSGFFKKTKAMETLLAEKRKIDSKGRQKREEVQKEASSQDQLRGLVDSIKRKVMAPQARQGKRANPR
ncbi:pre-rRNA-processing protein esf1 [Dinochytrium kinnereticum]|nr:pre-rRNA-processing protein esf1 [Dinochytrium kinnereticum]